MDLDLEILTEVEITANIDIAGLERLVPFTLADVGAVGRWTVTVVLTDDARLRALHDRFLGIDSETDVMTFPLGDDDNAVRGGDIVVSVERAAAQADDYGHGVAEEVRFLVVHGVLHLCGWNDQNADERSRMWDEQRRLLDVFDRSVAVAASGVDTP